MNRYWLIPVSGFDDQVAFAATAAKAKWVAFRGAREAGYFSGRDGFSRFVANLGFIREITAADKEARIGGHLALGEPSHVR